MKKTILTMLCMASLLSCSPQVSADPFLPVSNKQVVVGSVLIGVVTWLAGNYFLDKNKRFDMNTAMLSVAGVASLVGGYILSCYTAKSYLESGKRLVDGDDSSQPATLNIVDTYKGDPDKVVQESLLYFSTRDKTLLKSARSLGTVLDELEDADYFLTVARRGLSGSDETEALFYQDKIHPCKTTIRAACLIIKKDPSYDAQYAAEIEERKMRADANARRDAARISAHSRRDAARISAHSRRDTAYELARAKRDAACN